MDPVSVLAEVLDVLLHQFLQALRRHPHLSVFPAAFWTTVAAGLYLRYARRQLRRSQQLLRLTPAIGVLAVAAAAADLALGGRVEIIHAALAAYLAIPLGAGRRVVARLDALVATRRWSQPTEPHHHLRHLGQRQLTYLIALGLNVFLAAIAGDPYQLGSRPALDRQDPGSLAAVDWLHMAAFVFTAAIAVDAATTASRLALTGRTRHRRSPEAPGHRTGRR